MSYTLRPSEAGSARSLGAARAQQLPDGGADLAARSREVQELIEAIRGGAANVRKQARLLSTSGRRSPGSRGARDVAVAARARGEEARLLLRGLEPLPGGSVGERSAARLRREKLTESLQAVLAELAAARQAFEAADAAAVDPAPRSASLGVLALGDGAPPAAASAGDLEAGRARQLQATEDVAEAELEMHAAIVEGYAEQVGAVTRHVMEMRRALLDLAELAQSQGSVVDSLEQSMSRASGATSTAAEQIVVSGTKQGHSLKCVCWTLLMVTVLALAIVGIVIWRR